MFDKLKTFFDDKTDISEINFTPEQVATVALLISTAKYDGALAKTLKLCLAVIQKRAIEPL